MTKRASATYTALILLAFLSAPATARADLRLHGEFGGLAPLDEILRVHGGAGLTVAGSIDYEIVNLLALGVYYSFNDMITGGTLNVYDHTVGVRLDLRYVRHRIASWVGRSERSAYGEAFIELDLAYHNLGNQNRLGWAIGMGYRVLVAGPFGFGPFVRFRHVVQGFDDAAEDNGHHFYAVFGLELFFSFNLRGDRQEEPQPASQGASSGEDEWSEFEAVSTDNAPADDSEGDASEEGD